MRNMTSHTTATREEWLAGRLELLQAQKALTRRSDELARWRQDPQRMGWRFPWASSLGSDFNHDFGVTHTGEEWQSGTVEYNFRQTDFRPAEESPYSPSLRRGWERDFATYRREGPGVSAFALEDGVVYRTYSSYERGVDGIWGMCQWLDRAPLGRNETGFWWRRHDEYDRPTAGNRGGARAENHHE